MFGGGQCTVGTRLGTLLATVRDAARWYAEVGVASAPFREFGVEEGLVGRDDVAQSGRQ